MISAGKKDEAMAGEKRFYSQSQAEPHILCAVEHLLKDSTLYFLISKQYILPSL